MKTTVKELSPREKASILSFITKGIEEEQDKKTILINVQKYMIKIGVVEKSGAWNQMLSIAIAFYSMEKAKHEGKKPVDCIGEYASFKMACMIQLDDYGAFGDFIEVLIRVASKPASLVTWNDLHVKRQNAVDITIRGIPFEIGSNGKTFLESNEEYPMAGKFEKVAYGVFERDEKLAIFQLAVNGETQRAIENVLAMMYVFDKDTFQELLFEKCGRAPMLAWKKKNWQVIYNGSKHAAFLKMVELENISTLAEMLKK